MTASATVPTSGHVETNPTKSDQNRGFQCPLLVHGPATVADRRRNQYSAASTPTC